MADRANHRSGDLVVMRRIVFACAIVGVAFGVERTVYGIATSPLPTFAQRVEPVAVFVLDRSGSMNTCDGGTVNPNIDLTPKPNGDGYLFDPSSSTADDGACTADATYALRPNGTYKISRIEALKLAFSKILDVDRNGAIDSVDEGQLKIKIGLVTFPSDNGDTLYAVSSNIKRVGTSYKNIFAAVKGLTASGGTPTDGALAAARAINMSFCWDGNPATSCYLGPGQNNTTNGDDLALGCRDYYTIILTDGEPNHTELSAVGSGVVQIAQKFQTPTSQDNLAALKPGPSSNVGISSPNDPRPNGAILAWGPEVSTTKKVAVFSIGFGGARAIDSNARGYVNCTSYWGAQVLSLVDANKDGDANILTGSPTFPGGTETNMSCGDETCMTTVNNTAACKAARGYGDGWFASDATTLAQEFKAILNAIQAGTYSRSEPVFSPRSTLNAGFIYGSFFEVGRRTSQIDWEGHVRKYRFDSATGSFVDCNNPATSSTPLVPCWDGGGWYGLTPPVGTVFATGLYEKTWSDRVIFAPNPSNLQYDNDLNAQQNTRPATDATITVKNLVAVLSPLTLGSASLPGASTDLYNWSAMTERKDSNHLYNFADTIPADRLLDALLALSFTAGRPDSTFSDNVSRRCGTTTCTGPASGKLGDSFNSQSVVVGPPAGLVSDPDYFGEFFDRTLATGSGYEQGTYTGTEKVTVGGAAASPCKSGFTAPCSVKDRRTMVYLAANDGMLHAFDDHTGEELWAFLPPGHMPKLSAARTARTPYIDGLPLVRDVKFPCERANGVCSSATSDKFEDGRWHTLLVYNQGVGGNFFFALDVTNPVKPVFLWEFRNPKKMGFTVTRATIGELPDGAGLPDKSNPGSAVFATGGYTGVITTTGEADIEFHSLRAYDGKKLDSQKTDPKDLKDPRTQPNDLLNGQTGNPRAVDANNDGKVERVYFGDREGRMWKACNIKSDGQFDVKMFFDPALYNITSGGFIGQPVDKDDPTQGLTDANDRMTLRGPIFFSPDVTRDASGKVLVAFGSGNILDPLSSPDSYQNFIWVVNDDPSTPCSKATASVCAAVTGTNSTYTTPSYAPFGTKTYSNVVKLREMLTGPPVIFNKLLFYPEFTTDLYGTNDICTATYGSRIRARDVFTCASPTTKPFTVGGVASDTITYVGTLVTGVTIDPKSGAMFTQQSRGNALPTATGVPGVQVPPDYAGYRQLN